uniref:Uncharacterized protein n=1 Tax=Anguilla anguilla TaxID=7936 RepID=A0A0E9X1S7_ANGAN
MDLNGFVVLKAPNNYTRKTEQQHCIPNIMQWLLQTSKELICEMFHRKLLSTKYANCVYSCKISTKAHQYSGAQCQCCFKTLCQHFWLDRNSGSSPINTNVCN